METDSYCLPVGHVLNGKYQILEHLASGGFGNTYVVVDSITQQKMAVKEFFMKGVCVRDGDNVTVSHPDNLSVFSVHKKKFKHEAQRLSEFTNRHIVRVHELFEENNTVYLANKSSRVTSFWTIL